MKKTSYLAALLAASACGGGSPKPATPPGDVATASETPAPAGGPVAADPHLAARQAYQDPGGMWMPRQILDHADTLKQLGLEIDPAQLADPLSPVLGAIVSLGGCSASFVSPDGLIVTNHHCVQGALQYNSTPEQNLVENGFLARTRAEEKWAGPGSRVYVAQAIKDITKDIRDGIADIADPKKRHDEIEKREKALIAGCEKDRPSVRCKTGQFFRGAEWQLVEYLEIKDLRLVYVPHRGIGNYGGEIDNWAWPRHTGDFSFYRAYVGKDGQPADFAADNVPFKPKHVLKLQPQGVAPHDLVFVAGYPGKTSRLETAAETRRAMEWTLPRFLQRSNEKMAILAELVKGTGETAIKAGVAKQGVQNYLEKNQGILDGLTKGGVAAKKDALEAKFQEWAKSDPSRAKYTDALAAINAKLTEAWVTDEEDKEFSDLIESSKLFAGSMAIVRWAEERPKADADRKLGFQDRDWALAEAGIKAFGKRYDRTIDRAYFRLALKHAAELPEAKRPWLRDVLGVKHGKIDDKAIDAALDRLYGGTKLEDLAVRLDLFKNATLKSLKANKDPFLKLAMAVTPHARKLEARDDARAGELALIWPVYIEGLLASNGGKVAPDANSTLRLSYGTVRGYRPRPDAEVYEPFTTVSQIPAKNTGKPPFDAPKALLDAIKGGKWGPYALPNGEVPVDLLSDLDITNGNSGSAVLNGKGELIGLAFDGNSEGLASDVVFNPENTRTIVADVRYMLWVMDAVDQADHLLTEMGIKPVL